MKFNVLALLALHDRSCTKNCPALSLSLLIIIKVSSPIHSFLLLSKIQAGAIWLGPSSKTLQDFAHMHVPVELARTAGVGPVLSIIVILKISEAHTFAKATRLQ